ncbi:hepcidin-like [Cololabis saira]|uniref:hepcidin-like n=1 Tax=Cololabis saira TaxID=129043 RepID=UPI002AD2492D|nr:hepcidin-like [Cololabis saira]
MKTFMVALGVAVVLTFICTQASSAVPASEVHELMEAVADDGLVAAQEEMSVDSWKMPYHFRQKRAARRKRCRFCCECCPGMVGCGTCCKF